MNKPNKKKKEEIRNRLILYYNWLEEYGLEEDNVLFLTTDKGEKDEQTGKDQRTYTFVFRTYEIIGIKQDTTVNLRQDIKLNLYEDTDYESHWRIAEYFDTPLSSLEQRVINVLLENPEHAYKRIVTEKTLITS